MMFPVTRMLKRKCSGFDPSPASQSTVLPLPICIRFILVTLSGLVVCIVPNFSDLMNIIGAVFGTLLAFIMPGLCHYAIFRTHITRSDLIMDYMLVIIGFLGMILGVIEALNGDGLEDANDAVVNAAQKVASDVIQNQGGLPSHNLTNSNVHSDIIHSSTTSDQQNVIKESTSNQHNGAGVPEAIMKTINVASAAVTEKIANVMSKVVTESASNVLS